MQTTKTNNEYLKACNKAQRFANLKSKFYHVVWDDVEEKYDVCTEETLETFYAGQNSLYCAEPQ